MLDSSPVRLPASLPNIAQPSRPLKRSSSTMSLPTPPRTQKRASRSKGRRLQPQKKEQLESGDERVTKRRRTDTIPEVEEEFDDEDVFWNGPKSYKKVEDRKVAGNNGAPALDRQQTLSPPGSPVPVLERARKRAQSTTSSLASPPPSFRQTKTSVGKKPVAVAMSSPSPTELPRTPTRKSSPPVRDSPDNPFLDSPIESDADVAEDVLERASAADTESPFVTFVFRGVRKQFPNPYYDPVKKGPVSPPPNSLLPTDHVDFSPDTRCPPKVLFPEAHKRRARAAKQRKAARKTSDKLTDISEDEDDSAPMVKPTKLFAKELASQ